MISWKNDTPNILDTKVVKKFAWFPVLIGDTYYWLGHYYVKYRYEDGGYYNTLKGPNEGMNFKGKPMASFDKPMKWGSLGVPYWKEMGISLTPEDLPIYEIDNFYSKL